MTTKLCPAATVSWKNFITSFYEKFFPKLKKERFFDQFYELRQGQMTVDEFFRLVRFAPQLVPDKACKA